MKIIETKRLRLRQWQDRDYEPFAQLNADAEVMKYFPNTLTKEQSDAQADKARHLIEKNGWGFWALELKDSKQFIGLLGLHEEHNLPFSPCVEMGWRLARPYWGHGYATEAAQKTLDFAFNQLNLNEVVAFTCEINQPSRQLMERIGMTNTHHNFKHPKVPNDSPLCEHVLYKIL